MLATPSSILTVLLLVAAPLVSATSGSGARIHSGSSFLKRQNNNNNGNNLQTSLSTYYYRLKGRKISRNEEQLELTISGRSSVRSSLSPRCLPGSVQPRQRRPEPTCGRSGRFLDLDQQLVRPSVSFDSSPFAQTLETPPLLSSSPLSPKKTHQAYLSLLPLIFVRIYVCSINL